MTKGEPLTPARCHNLPSPISGNKLYRCANTKGLALRVTAKGHRSFVFSYSNSGGRERRMTVGELGPWSLPAARKRVEHLRRLVDQGTDPLADKEARRARASLGDVWDWYSRNVLTKLSAASRRDIGAAWIAKIEPSLGGPNVAADEVGRHHIQAMVDRITTQSGPVAANRCHSFVRRIFNLAKAEGLMIANPASQGIFRNQEHGRERFLTKDEIKALIAAIDARGPHPSALAIKLLMLTGARRSEVMSMKWSDLDLVAGLWVKPATATKQNRIHRAMLSAAAVKLLINIRAKGPSSKYVFPGPGKSGHLTDLKREWARLASAAHLDECRIHDLRHTYASILVSQGESLELIGAMLGHSQVQTTKRYAHLFQEPLRAAAEAVSAALAL